VLGWEDASAARNREPIGSAKAGKAKRQSKVVARNDKSAPLFHILVHGARSVPKGTDFDKDAAPQMQTLGAVTAEEAGKWVSAINAATQSLAHDVMASCLKPGNAALSARAVKLLVIEGGAPGHDAPVGVSLNFCFRFRSRL
jgi:hypothetical protein